MKVRSSLRRICASCKLVKRGRKLFVICPANARHKQRQGLHTTAAMNGEATTVAQAAMAPYRFDAMLPGGFTVWTGATGLAAAARAAAAGGLPMSELPEDDEDEGL